MNGSIERRGKKSFRLTVSGGFDSSGKRIRHQRTIKVQATTEKGQAEEAEKALAAFVLEIERGEFFGAGKMTLKEFAELWLQDYGKHSLAPKTYFRYKEIIEGRINDSLGHIKLEQLRPAHLVKFYSQLQEDGSRKDGKGGGLSGKTIQQHHRILSSIFSTACQWEAMRSNPASRVKPPKVQKANVNFYDEEKAEALLNALQQEPFKYQVMVAIALVTGCRRQELFALTWGDINFENRTITINKAAQYLSGRGMFLKSTKNTESERDVPIPAFTLELLKAYRKAWIADKMKIGEQWQLDKKDKYSEEWKGLEPLFITWNGFPMHIDTITKWFPKFLDRHGLPRINFHALRHSAATLFIAWGIPPRSVSKLLGHARTSTTQDIYAKSLKSVEKIAAERMNSAFGKKEEKEENPAK